MRRSNKLRFSLLACSLLCLLISSKRTYGQVITTIAGNGGLTYSGDGGPATNAGISNMAGVAADVYGNVYHAESQRIRRTSASGIINTYAGGGSSVVDDIPATDATIDPTGVATDEIGNVYITTGARIRKVGRSGIITTVAGTGLSGYSGDGGPATSAMIYEPTSVVTDWMGNVYFVSIYHVRKVDTFGTIRTIAGGTTNGFSGDGGPATNALFNVPRGITIDPLGNVYVADAGNNRVRKINALGIISTFAGTGGTSFSGDGGPATDAEIQEPIGITSDNFGNIYVSDIHQRIRKIDADGIISTFAGTGIPGFTGDGGPATAANLNAPWQISSHGNLYISTLNSRRVRMVTSPNAAPNFTHGHVQTVTVCPEIFPLDSLLQVMDADTGQLLRWTLIGSPAHGSASVYYTATSTGGVITPTGLVYTHGTGFTGVDTVRVRVTDGVRCDTTTICMTVECPSDILRYKAPDELAVYPSPNNGSFVVQLPGLNSEAHIVISNTLGQAIKEINTTDKHISIQLDAPPGIYFVRVSADGNSWSKKVVVR